MTLDDIQYLASFTPKGNWRYGNALAKDGIAIAGVSLTSGSSVQFSALLPWGASRQLIDDTLTDAEYHLLHPTPQAQNI